MANGDTKTESYLRVAAEGTRADLPSDTCCNTKTQNLILGVANRIMDVEDEVEEIKNNPDVVDIVATYADLQAYDKSKLTDKDIIRVLDDETHNDDSTYYRYDKSTDAFTYIGESKQYTNFVGTDGTTAGTSGLVPAPATADAGKYLKSDGTWGTVQAGPTVVQTTGTSTTQVMSQNATTSMVYADPSAKKRIKMGASATIISDSTKVATSIGNRAKATGANSIAISGNKDFDATASGTTSIMIGRGSASNTGSVAIGMATASGQNSVCLSANNTTASGMYAVAINGTVGGMGSVAIGTESSVATAAGSVALGACSSVTTKGTVGIGTTNTNYGYNSSNYRLLTGLYDPQGDHDAATKGYVDNHAKFFNIADIVQAAFENPGAQETITLEEYEAVQEACMNFLPLAYCREGGSVYEFTLFSQYDCTYSSGITVNGETISSIMGNFTFQFNNGQPYVRFDQM